MQDRPYMVNCRQISLICVTISGHFCMPVALMIRAAILFPMPALPRANSPSTRVAAAAQPAQRVRNDSVSHYPEPNLASDRSFKLVKTLI